jgi:acyl-coenzyme A synthetase/AMP-(fatty) acid ligase
VQAALTTHPRVASGAAVVTESAQEPHLVGFYTCRGEPVPGADLRRHLAQRLPEYMVPSRLIALRHLPVNANGKLNRGELVRQARQAVHVHGASCGRFCVGQ